jgi:hypothetical protein
VQLVGAPLGLGFVAARAYFGLLRPRLVAAVQARPAEVLRDVPSQRLWS